MARDLMFHVQEHCFGIPEISNMLKELSLEFLGFRNPLTKTKYSKYFPNDTCLFKNSPEDYSGTKIDLLGPIDDDDKIISIISELWLHLDDMKAQRNANAKAR